MNLKKDYMMNEDDLLADFLPSQEGMIAMTILKYHVFGDDVDESELGLETLRLRNRYRQKGMQNFHLSLTPRFKGTSEDLAKFLNEQEDWISDPVNNLVSRIGGYIFEKKDYVACTENSKRVSADPPYFHPVEMTDEELRRVREYREDIGLFEAAVDMIKDLKAQLDARR